MTAFKNEFSWSKSRDEIFRECRRKYYYSKYGFWEGWNFNADPGIREIYILKQLKSRYMWKGEVVHYIVSETIKDLEAERYYPLNHYLDLLTARMRNDFRMSANRYYRENPKKTTGLFEHEYNIDVAKEEWVKLSESARDCLKNFFADPFYARLRDKDSTRVLQNEKTQKFTFEGTTIWVKLDLVIKDNSGITIIDWKTGRFPDNDFSIQLGCYSLYAMQQWNLSLKDLSAVEFNLGSLKNIIHEIDEDKLNHVKSYMKKSIISMKKLLYDPLKNLARKDDFACTDNEKACRMCNFKKVCKTNTGYKL
ncbi:MAG: PD-(D/E)XK nuclease family protein [Candidatus Omnitrophota bacterium]|nr:PD-(D/E)XK nuclease family protein [Candidatus Omnitrophota bacterium]